MIKAQEETRKQRGFVFNTIYKFWRFFLAFYFYYLERWLKLKVYISKKMIKKYDSFCLGKDMKERS